MRQMISATGVALTSLRLLGYAVLAWTLFYLANARGKWYRGHFFPNDDLEYELNVGVAIRSSHNQKAIFLLLFPILVVVLGGIYEAVWKTTERSKSRTHPETSQVKAGDVHVSFYSFLSAARSVLSRLHGMVHYQFKPLGSHAPWVSVGESAVLLLWVAAMFSHLWQGVHGSMEVFYDRTGPCPDDPSSRCYVKDDGIEPAPTPAQNRLAVVAAYFGFAASFHFAVILIPVSRDSKLWSAVGIPFERAVLYHAVAGHLAFTAMFLHAFVCSSSWAWKHGWGYVWTASTTQVTEEYGDVDVPMGWGAVLCAMPMWITSTNYVRRRWYSLFKFSHWLFIGVLVFGALHWDANAIYFAGGLALYTMHVMSRLSAWKRWRYWNRWWNPPTENKTPTRVVDVCTIKNYTRLVLHNPKSHEPARGGSFVYISAPGVLGTGEAHAMTVALRGAPPSYDPEELRAYGIPREGVFTLYVKALGRWTEALRSTAKGAEAAGDPASLLVDVDGFYTHVTSFNTMLRGGAGRIVAVVGGSGVTALMGYIQDWCLAASADMAVPEVHLVWSCRSMSEMELVGESLPSLLASTGSKKDSHFTLSLYCTSKDGDGPLSVTWPLNNRFFAGSSHEEIMGTTPVASSLNHSVRAIVAGGAAYGGFVLGNYEVNRGEVGGFHVGGALLVLIVICIISALLVYDWLISVVRNLWPEGVKTQIFARATSIGESKMDVESATSDTATYQVSRGRVPAKALFSQEAALAHKKGLSVVKVLTSGPQALVDSVLTESRAVDWELFDTEEYSFVF